jgi:hypothetical protein
MGEMFRGILSSEEKLAGDPPPPRPLILPAGSRMENMLRAQSAADMTEIILMTHVLFGMVCIILAVWVFVDVLRVSDSNLARIRILSWVIAGAMWLAFLIAGYWYVVFYKVDKAVILKGPWPFAHSLVMETKEHLVIMLLLLVTYLPIAASNNLVANKEARRLVLWVAGMIALTGLLMDGEGAIIAMGAKVGLMAK